MNNLKRRTAVVFSRRGSSRQPDLGIFTKSLSISSKTENKTVNHKRQQQSTSASNGLRSGHRLKKTKKNGSRHLGPKQEDCFKRWTACSSNQETILVCKFSLFPSEVKCRCILCFDAGCCVLLSCFPLPGQLSISVCGHSRTFTFI